MQTAKCFEVYTPDGALIFRGYLTERELQATPQTDNNAQVALGQQRGNGASNGETMTSPQRRKLFRLLAIKGIDGDQAHDELKKLFQVESLDDVGKSEASKMIDRLVQETKGGK